MCAPNRLYVFPTTIVGSLVPLASTMEVVVANECEEQSDLDEDGQHVLSSAIVPQHGATANGKFIFEVICVHAQRIKSVKLADGLSNQLNSADIIVSIHKELDRDIVSEHPWKDSVGNSHFVLPDPIESASLDVDVATEFCWYGTQNSYYTSCLDSWTRSANRQLRLCLMQMFTRSQTLATMWLIAHQDQLLNPRPNFALSATAMKLSQHFAA